MKPATLFTILALLPLASCTLPPSNIEDWKASGALQPASDGAFSNFPPLPPGCLEGQRRGFSVGTYDPTTGVPAITC